MSDELPHIRRLPPRPAIRSQYGHTAAQFFSGGCGVVLGIGCAMVLLILLPIMGCLMLGGGAMMLAPAVAPRPAQGPARPDDPAARREQPGQTDERREPPPKSTIRRLYEGG